MQYKELEHHTKLAAVTNKPPPPQELLDFQGWRICRPYQHLPAHTVAVPLPCRFHSTNGTPQRLEKVTAERPSPRSFFVELPTTSYLPRLSLTAHLCVFA